MLSLPAVGKLFGALSLVGCLLVSWSPPAEGKTPRTPAEEALCLGQISGLAVVGGELFVATQAGLYRWSEDGGDRLQPVRDLDPQPVKSLLRVGDALLLTWGNLTTVRLERWDGVEHLFAAQAVVATPAEEPIRFFKGFPVKGQAAFAGEVCTATLGGGLYLGDRRLENGPPLVTAAVAWKESIAVGSPEGLYFLGSGETLVPLFENPCRDCRVTCFASWRGEVYAGTLNGGVLRLPGYGAIDEQPGLTARVNALAAGRDRLFVGTEAGLSAWDGRTLSRDLAIGDESVKALAADDRYLYLTTTSGLKRYDLRSGRVDALSIRKGAFLALYRGDLYIGGMFGVWKADLTRRFAVTRVLHENVTGFAVYDNDLYAAGYYNGLWRLSGAGPEKVAEGQFSTIAPVPEGLLLGTGEAGVMFYPPEAAGRQTSPRPVWPTATVTALLSAEGMVYVGTPAGYALLPWGDLVDPGAESLRR